MATSEKITDQVGLLESLIRFINLCDIYSINPAKAMSHIVTELPLNAQFNRFFWKEEEDNNNHENHFTVNFTEKSWSIAGFGLNLNERNTPNCEGKFRYYDLYYYNEESGRDMLLVLTGTEKSGKPIMNTIPLEE